VLIFVGAMVASTRSGMAFMDWPTSNGLIWPGLDKWFHQKDMFWEHFHRLIAEVVGGIAICLVICSFFVHQKKFLKPTIILLLAIIVQGVFGGLTVGKLTAWWTSTLHGIVAQIVFAYMVVVFFQAGKIAKNITPVVDNDNWLRSLPKAVCIIVLFQLFLGATFRHKMKVAQFSSEIPIETVSEAKQVTLKNAGHYSIKVKAPGKGNFSVQINSSAGKQELVEKNLNEGLKGELFSLGDVELQAGVYTIIPSEKISTLKLVGPERIEIDGEELKFQIIYKEVLKGNEHLMWAHVAFAIVVTMLVLLLAIYLFKKKGGFTFLGKIATGIISCLVIQLGLGVVALLTVSQRQRNIYDQTKTILTSAHLANGAILLALCVLALYFCRIGFVKSESGE
jgi:heme A synthase